MAGVASYSAPEPRPADPSPVSGEELFSALVVSSPLPSRSGVGLRFSFVAHVVIIGLAILVPILWPSAPPEHPNYIVISYNPPPPPPPPLPQGSALIQRTDQVKPVTPDTKPEKPKFTADLEVPKEQELKPEAKTPEAEQFGSQTGSAVGVAEGVEGGSEFGQVGGVFGGVPGGVVGGTGNDPVTDYDKPPALLFQPKFVYPQEAFVKKIEGEVLLQILIDREGRVVQARVVRSISALDAAALQYVRQWRFAPAIKAGRPVATIAQTPIRFRIF